MLKGAVGAFALGTAVLALSGCGNDSQASGGEGATGPTPNPMSVQIAVDESRATTAGIPVEGGTVSVEAKDGTLYTLVIPPDALLTETDITMTPLSDVDGAPVSGGRLMGVQLAPDGLRLYQPAVLTVSPPGHGPAVEALTFSSVDGGQDLGLFPLDVDPASITFRLLHFSEYFGYLDIGEGTQLTVAPGTFIPTDWESQLQHALAELFKAERDAILNGEDGDPEFVEKLEAIIREQFTQVIAPLLPEIASDCSAFDANNHKALAWVRTAELAVLGSTFSEEIGEINVALLSGADRCWQEAIEPCVNPNDGAQMNRLGALARQAIFLGGDEGQYNPQDPDLQCEGPAWSGTASHSQYVHYTEDGGHYTEEVRLEVTFTGDAAVWNATAYIDKDTGWDECIRDTATMQASASGPAALGVFENGEWTWVGDPEAEGALVVELKNYGPHGYQVWIYPPYVNGTVRNVHEERPPCSDPSDRDEWDSEWHMVDTSEIVNKEHGLSYPNIISDTFTRGDEGINTRSWSWHFERQGVPDMQAGS